MMKRVYSNPPSINEIDIFSIDVKRDGPTVIMSFDLVNSLPDKTPDKWGKDFNRCRAGIYCFGVSNLNMQGIETDMVTKIDIKMMDNNNIVSIKNNDIDIKFICSHISLTGPSVYIRK
ncbi:hypothetical protein GPY23_21415 [Photorhabdus bodei]|uniref:Immunity protein 50 n=1 Tax=Photorhabdus bodei TaxID=2029681 RepID=A0ABX0AUC4_9GAMM|nr:hypothetical protein [Photorhabdus bodei]NDL05317.1 hypothetical protein [Photorhabdus bodei]NDL09712.1 hypothetical protein [Photorhabdus bodei]